MIAQSDGNDGKSTILIVEHDDPTVSYYRQVLGHEYHIVVASTGKSALELPLGSIDVALVELRLPDMQGMAVLKAMREKHPSLPFLIVTQYGCEDAAVKAFRSGAKDYLKKPVSYLELHRAIESCLCRKPRASGDGSVGAVDEVRDRATSPWHDMACSGRMGLQVAIKFINDNYMESISLSAVAGKASLSKYHFCRTFKSQLGVSFTEYLNRTRIEKAKEILAIGGVSITDVALTVGYNDVTHFGRMFKRVHGCTPSQYVATSRNGSRPPARAMR